MSIRVVLGEDNVLVREGVRALLNSYEDIDVVGVASDAPSLLETAGEHTPDVVVTDIKMPPNFQLEGIDCAHTIRGRHPETGVVVLSAHDDEAYAIALLGQGHSGLAYLLKDRISQGDELARAIREVASGGSVVDPTIAERLSGRNDAADEDREILEMMAQGLGYEMMAERLETTQEAVDRRVTELFRRMAVAAEGGSAAAFDGLKRLHAAVVQKESAATAFRSFVPRQVAERIELGGSAGALTRELDATILFSDIRGYSTLAEHLPPGEVAELVGRHLAAMTDEIQLHGGLVDQFIGDAVMGVFGAPEPESDHAERAVRCAIAMQSRQRELNEEAEASGRLSLHIGIGINSGPVVAGVVGTTGRFEYTVVGDAVNVAARLQNEAAAGEIVASAATVSAIPGFRSERMGPRTVKGREEPVEVFRVLDD